MAIAIHNIPERIAVSEPIYYATGSRLNAFKFSFLSGLSKQVRALVGYLILMPFFASAVFIMVFISLDELLPAAEVFGEHHLTIHGVVSGMGVMALSLLMFL